MSRGPGKWQRLILDAVDENGWCVVCDLLPEDAKHAQVSAINRAAHTLADAGEVDLFWRSRQTTTTNPRSYRGRCSPTVVVVMKPGTEAPIQTYQDGEMIWISVEEYDRQHAERMARYREFMSKCG